LESSSFDDLSIFIPDSLSTVQHLDLGSLLGISVEIFTLTPSVADQIHQGKYLPLTRFKVNSPSRELELAFPLVLPKPGLALRS
jgi:hypothetical protein